MAHSQTVAKPRPIQARARPKAAAERTGAGGGAKRGRRKTDKTRPSARLLITHPDIDPAAITERLGIQPAHCSKKGEPRKTPRGTPLPGVYPDTRWSISFPNEENLSIGELVAEAIETLPVTSRFWSELAQSGGEAELILEIVGTKYQGSSLDIGAVRQLANMGMRLGIEIYDVPQNR